MRYLIATLFIALATDLSYGREVYKCKDKNGRISFQDTSCGAEESQSVVDIAQSDVQSELPKSESDSSFLIPKSQLVGTWTDVYPKSEFSSTWTFTESALIFRRYSGMEIRASYTLENDKIVVHHKKSARTNSDWDDIYEIKTFKDGVLVVSNITTMRWHKL